MTREYARWQKESIIRALNARRAVIVSGARQSGKTTLVKQFKSVDNQYRTLDDTSMLKVAQADPHGFIKRAQGTMIIDEIQKAPDLLPAIKMAVDADNTYGQFLLTGSADVYSLPTVTESLAGRVAIVRLRPLTNGEILETEPTFLEKAFNMDWPLQITGYDKETVIEMAFRGGFPEVLNLSFEDRKAWHLDYTRALLERDLRNVANIRRKSAIQKVVEILMSWSGKYMDIAGICGGLTITRSTLETYINLLEAIYLFEEAPAWIVTDYDRVGKRSRIYAGDTGLMASVLNWRMDEVVLDSDKSGKIIETLVFNELSAQIDMKYGYSLSQYRDRTGREIDFLVENDRGAILGVEVKAGSAVSKNDFKHLTWFRTNLVKDRKFFGIVLYTGENVLPFGPDMYAVPISALWM